MATPFSIRKYWVSMMSRIQQILILVVTLFLLSFIENSFLVLLALISLWFFFYYPLKSVEVVACLIAGVFFLGQNYAVLKSGGFEFSQKDILLMPCYEPFLWGFYYLNIRRFFKGVDPDIPALRWKAVAGLVATGIAFSFFSANSQYLLIASSISTAIVLILFHSSLDFAYGLYGLLMGLFVELVGVTTGHWSYPDPDFMGIPYWFANMWISVAVLGRRFLFPLAALVVDRFGKPAQTENS